MAIIRVGQIISIKYKFTEQEFKPLNERVLLKISHVGERYILANRVTDGLEFAILINHVKAYYESPDVSKS